MPLAMLLAVETARSKWKMLGGRDSTERPAGMQPIWGLLEQKHLVARGKETKSRRQALRVASGTLQNIRTGARRRAAYGKAGGSRIGLWSHMVRADSQVLFSDKRAVRDHAPRYHPRLPGSQKLLATHVGFPHKHGHEIQSREPYPPPPPNFWVVRTTLCLTVLQKLPDWIFLNPEMPAKRRRQAKAWRPRGCCLGASLKNWTHGSAIASIVGNRGGTANRPKWTKRETQSGYLLGTTAHGKGEHEIMAQRWARCPPGNGWNATISCPFPDTPQCYWPTGHTTCEDTTIWDKVKQKKISTACPNLTYLY